MGGVDLMDRMIAHYPHGFKNRKWYLRIFFHLLNMSIVNSWILYRKTNENTSLLNFKASTVWTMLELGKANKRGRKSSLDSKSPSTKKKPKNRIPPELRYNGVDHYPIKKETGQAFRYSDVYCSSRTRYLCDKCQCAVCPECMKTFHTK